MGKYFTIGELVASDTARQQGIDNAPPPDTKRALSCLITNLLDPIRESWGRPINVNSGFRSPTLNRIVGGAASSQHVKGEAADITAGDQATNKQLFDLIVRMNAAGEISFDQLIWEKGDAIGPRWIHISYKATGNRGQILKL